MRRRDLLTAIAAAALAAAAKPAAAEVRWDNARLLMKLPLSPGDSVQGVWMFPDKSVLMTQDMDGNNAKGSIRFSLLSPQGEVRQRWDIPYGTHGQSVYVARGADGYLVYTEQKDFHGLALFRLSADLSEMSFVREILPVTADGRPLYFKAFGVDRTRDVILCARIFKHRLAVQYYSFSDFVKGVAVPVGGPIAVEERPDFQLGWLQGAGTSDGIAYVLVGDSSKKSKKRIVRIMADGSYDTIFLRAARRRAIFGYEPEALYVQSGRAVFGVYDLFLSRLYTLSLK